jgi:hypothetical protein
MWRLLNKCWLRCGKNKNNYDSLLLLKLRYILSFKLPKIHILVQYFIITSALFKHIAVVGVILIWENSFKLSFPSILKNAGFNHLIINYVLLRNRKKGEWNLSFWLNIKSILDLLWYKIALDQWLRTILRVLKRVRVVHFLLLLLYVLKTNHVEQVAY